MSVDAARCPCHLKRCSEAIGGLIRAHCLTLVSNCRRHVCVAAARRAAAALVNAHSAALKHQGHCRGYMTLESGLNSEQSSTSVP